MNDKAMHLRTHKCGGAFSYNLSAIITRSRPLILPAGKSGFSLLFSRYPIAIPRRHDKAPAVSENSSSFEDDIPPMPALSPVKNESADNAVPSLTPSDADMVMEPSLSAADGDVRISEHGITFFLHLSAEEGS